MCLSLLYCDDSIMNKTLSLYDAMQDSYHIEIASSDDDITEVIDTLIFHTCYRLPELFVKHGGVIKDNEIEYP